MKISKLKPGDVVFSVEKTKMGNTTLKTVSVFRVYIKEVHETHVIASWNGNPARRFGLAAVNKWKEKEPVRIQIRPSYYRLATKEEIAQMEKEKAEKKAD
jgi:hypothetical protein